MFPATWLRPAAPRAGTARARLLGWLLAATGVANGAFAQSFLRADGTRIVNASN
ncbi:hypothetical protein [Hymenobacter sp.]|uniref:hypothetical protein n=1 Tax=Hymenobacter sp. TaxID=1898978 RepID=UPI00286C1593|nr:hypothetical protein [Hymenobacter sp.]